MDEPSYKRRLPAGVVDTSFASLATFIIGLAAVNLLDDAERGVYSVYFTAFLLGVVLVRDLVFTPSQVRAVEYDTKLRLRVLGQSLPLGILPALLGASAAVITYLVTPQSADPSVSFALMVTSAVTMILSPMQDHVRLMLHIGARSWMAASVSIVQLVTVIVVLGLAIFFDVPAGWVPFGTLAVANAVSLTVGRILAHRAIGPGPPEKLTIRQLAKSGRWLVLQSTIPAISLFVVAWMVAGLAGLDAAGYAESARVVAQPVMVLAMGLSSVLAPRSMRAAMDLDRAKARHTNRIYVLLITGAAVGYAAIVGWDWALNPMAYLVPSAYEVPGLVLVTIAANAAIAFVFLTLNELLGAKREKLLVGISGAVAVARLALGATAGVTGAFARPLALLGGASTRIAMQHRALRPVYEAGGGDSSDGSTIESDSPSEAGPPHR